MLRNLQVWSLAAKYKGARCGLKTHAKRDISLSVYGLDPDALHTSELKPCLHLLFRTCFTQFKSVQHVLHNRLSQFS
jgi:hypothetical protein